MNVMKNWKNQIRSTMMQVKSEFVDWIDTFTIQFIRSLKGIEGQRELADLGGFMVDATLRRMMEELRESYVKIMLIFNDVTKETIHEKLNNIDKTKKTIKEIEATVKHQDQELVSLHDRVKMTQRKTVELQNLNQKIQQKFLRYIDKRINNNAFGRPNETVGVSMMQGDGEGPSTNFMKNNRNSYRPQVESSNIDRNPNGYRQGP